MKGGHLGAEGVDPDVALGRGLGAKHKGAMVALLHFSVLHHLDALHVALVALGGGIASDSVEVSVHKQKRDSASNQKESRTKGNSSM